MMVSYYGLVSIRGGESRLQELAEGPSRGNSAIPRTLEYRTAPSPAGLSDRSSSNVAPLNAN